MDPGLATLEEIVRAAGLEDGPTAAAYGAYLSDRFRHEPHEPHEPYATRALADLYLAFACLSGSRAAAARLGDALVQTSVGSRKVRIPDATADDARQIVFERLVGSAQSSPKIASYDGRGPLGAWLRVSVAREALYLHRQRTQGAANAWVDELVKIAAPDDDPELASLKHELRTECRAALERAARALASRERALLRQHLVLGMTVDELGPVYGVHRATAARWISAAKDALLERFYAEVEASTGLARAEAQTLRSLVQSRLDMSVASLFATASAGA